MGSAEAARSQTGRDLPCLADRDSPVLSKAEAVRVDQARVVKPVVCARHQIVGIRLEYDADREVIRAGYGTICFGDL